MITVFISVWWKKGENTTSDFTITNGQFFSAHYITVDSGYVENFQKSQLNLVLFGWLYSFPQIWCGKFGCLNSPTLSNLSVPNMYVSIQIMFIMTKL